MTTEQIEQFIRGNVGKTVSVVYPDGETENLFVHNTDDEGFVCDRAADMAEPPLCAYWVRFADVSEARSTPGESPNVR